MVIGFSFGLLMGLAAAPPAAGDVAPPPSPSPAEEPSEDVAAPAPSPASPAPAPAPAEALAPAPAPAEAPTPAPSPIAEVETVVSPVVVDYSNTWDDSAPGRTVVITRVVAQPRPAHRAAPDPVPAPRAHGFIGASFRGTAVNRNPSVLSGARAGFTFDDRFTIGGAFYSLTARYAGPIVDGRGNELGLRMAYGGVLLAWNVYRGRVLHVALESLAGAGAACVSKDRRSYGKARCIEKVGLVSIEPGIEVGVTATDWARISLTGGYRFVTREAWQPPNDFMLSGPYVGLNFDLGRFRDRDRD